MYDRWFVSLGKWSEFPDNMKVLPFSMTVFRTVSCADTGDMFTHNDVAAGQNEEVRKFDMTDYAKNVLEINSILWMYFDVKYQLITIG